MTAKYHPSNTLYSGKVRDFLEAVELDRAQQDHEFDRFPQYITDDDRRAYEAYRASTDRAEAIYREVVEPLLDEARRKGVEALRAAGIDHYADALATGDYTRLAI